MAPVNTQYLSAHTDICYLLQRLHKDRVLLYVRPGSHTRSFHSAVLGVDPAQNQFILDELAPLQGHQSLYPDCGLHIHAKLKGVQIHMDSTLSRIDYEDGIALYHLPLPTEIIYRQRRRHFRALLNNKQMLPIVLPVESRQQIAGRLVDVSVGGVCSRFSPEDARQLNDGQTIHSARIDLPGRNSTIICDLAVRCMRDRPERGDTLVGSEIIDIDPRSQHTLERFVASQDRARQRHLRL